MPKRAPGRPPKRDPRTPRGWLLRRVRKFLKLTRQRMARKMGCDPATLWRWEFGAAPMPDSRLDTLLVMVLDADHDERETPRLLKAIREERRP